jgi:hypothetical protein
MKPSGPYLTLAGGLIVAGVLLALSLSAVDRDNAKVVNAAAPSATAATDAEPTDAEQTDATTPPSEPAKPEPSAAGAIAPSGTYAGKVKGGGASVAVAIKGSTAIAYVCDGKKVEGWLHGAADTPALSLAGDPSSTLTAKYAKGWLTGTVQTDGKKWTFRVKAVTAPSGLYRAARNVRKAKVVSGWIVADGKQVGMVSRSTGVESPAPPIDLASRTATIDGTTVQADVVDGSPIG